MEAIIIVPVVFITFYLIIELFVHRRERLMIVEKLAQNQSLDLSELNLSQGPMELFSGLKIGCLLCGLGLGFLFSFLLHVVFQDVIGKNWGFYNALTFGAVLTFGGIGLIVAYLIEKQKK